MLADDLAAVLAGNIGDKYTSQCLDFEHKLKVFFDYLEYHDALFFQPVNRIKTEAIWSARAIGPPKFDISLADTKIKWVNEYNISSICEHLSIMSNSLCRALCGPPEQILLEMGLSIMSTSSFC